ncbi:MAG: VPLPA-CTERM sorting domain-containing protein [Candidatus Obscuribacterales bacterium]|nr:VPLPA-CTERM sorting domain-containing protein [Steroidobacteraceae bacterium]
MKNKTVAMAVAIAVLASGAGGAQAASISYYLNQSNADAVLPDGTNYALVTINDDVANTLRFTVSLFAPLTSIAGSNFGIDSFAFNVIGANPLQDFGAIAGQWTLPTGWIANVAPPPNQADGFGRFDAEANGSGGARVATLNFSIHNTALNLYSFAENSSNNAGQGNVFFSAHIAGFNAGNGVTSAYFGGSTLVPVPLPATLPFLLSALGGLGLIRRRVSVLALRT